MEVIKQTKKAVAEISPKRSAPMNGNMSGTSQRSAGSQTAQLSGAVKGVFKGPTKGGAV